ncbi:hypothetical protein FB567DRAFT_590580 [Paraphoma chrysanthemicola]|uniref:Uncharacterized protein n=1 Tax=Paraphoma chrysanthemicola TaxID=798071 RepID=A0A8K0W1D8_9PLEO|nr:hypothetical protein FB567DRAFT_590580 [Paraphoma chrysanthemicola]
MQAPTYQVSQAPAPGVQQAESAPLALYYANQHGQLIAHIVQNGYGYSYFQCAPLAYLMYRNPYAPGPATATCSGYYGPSVNSYIYVAQPYATAMGAMVYGHQGHTWNISQEQPYHISAEADIIASTVVDDHVDRQSSADIDDEVQKNEAQTFNTQQEDVKQTTTIDPAHSEDHIERDMKFGEDAHATAGAHIDVVATVCEHVSVQGSSELDIHHIDEATKIDDAHITTVKEEPTAHVSKEEIIGLVPGEASTVTENEARDDTSSTTTAETKSSEYMKLEVAPVDNTKAEARPTVEKKTNGSLSGNAWDDTPLVEGWDYQRSEDWTPQGKRARGPRSKNNNRTGGETRQSRSSTASTASSSSSPPSKRAKQEPVATQTRRVQGAATVRRERAVLPTSNAWGNFATLIKEGDKNAVVKAQEHDKLNGGAVFRPEIKESYKARKGATETHVYEQVAPKVSQKEE